MEKRAFIRQKMYVRVNGRKIIGTPKAQEEFQGVSEDISAGGICLVVSEKLMIGDRVEIGIELPSEKIKAKGRVVWISKSGINGGVYGKMYYEGIEFTEIRKDDREEINKFVSEYIYAKEED